MPTTLRNLELEYIKATEAKQKEVIWKKILDEYSRINLNEPKSWEELKEKYTRVRLEHRNQDGTTDPTNKLESLVIARPHNRFHSVPSQESNLFWFHEAHTLHDQYKAKGMSERIIITDLPIPSCSEKTYSEQMSLFRKYKSRFEIALQNERNRIQENEILKSEDQKSNLSAIAPITQINETTFENWNIEGTAVKMMAQDYKENRVGESSLPNQSTQQPKAVELLLINPHSPGEAFLGKERGNKFRVANHCYENHLEIAETIANIARLAALKSGLLITEATDIIRNARKFGGISNIYNSGTDSYNNSTINNTTAKKFSKLFQQECGKCGIYSGRENKLKTPVVGLRTAFVPEEVLILLEKDSEVSFSQEALEQELNYKRLKIVSLER